MISIASDQSGPSGEAMSMMSNRYGFAKRSTSSNWAMHSAGVPSDEDAAILDHAIADQGLQLLNGLAGPVTFSDCRQRVRRHRQLDEAPAQQVAADQTVDRHAPAETPRRITVARHRDVQVKHPGERAAALR
jgi:hypothetical protein